MRCKRARKWAKWTCTLAAGAAVGLAVGSRFFAWGYGITGNVAGTVWRLQVYSGLVVAMHWDELPPELVSGLSGRGVSRNREWCWGYTGEKTSSDNLGGRHSGVLYVSQPHSWMAGASVMYPVALTLVPTALLWYADRRRFGHGQCPACGYSRAGFAADAKCPECGTVPGA